MIDKMYAFDLDGTVTKEEILPLIAKELNLEAEMMLLTRLTLDGRINFEQSFRLRYHILKDVPLKKIHEITAHVKLDEDVFDFIKENSDRCAVVTGNLDLWIRPIIDRLGCLSFSSIGAAAENDRIRLVEVLYKSDAIRKMKERAERVIAVGESFNDVPMFEEADVSISFGGVHEPVNKAISISDFVVYRGDALCRLLNML